MPVYEPRRVQKTEVEQAIQRVRASMHRAVRTMQQCVQVVNRQVAQHGRAALATVIQAQGDDPADLLTVYNAVKDALATVTGDDQPELPA